MSKAFLRRKAAKASVCRCSSVLVASARASVFQVLPQLPPLGAAGLLPTGLILLPLSKRRFALLDLRRATPESPRLLTERSAHLFELALLHLQCRPTDLEPTGTPSLEREHLAGLLSSRARISRTGLGFSHRVPGGLKPALGTSEDTGSGRQ
jgi:hypothetical protein